MKQDQVNERGRVRAALTRRPALEPVIFVALALVYSWFVRPTGNDWLKGPLLLIVVAIPFLSNILHRDSLRDLGLRFDNLRASIREVGIATVVGAAAVVLIGLAAGDGPGFQRSMLGSFLVYPIWGLVQQYAMQSFTFRRVREGIRSPAASAAITALLFALVHMPNLALALSTLVGGYVWCRLFDRHPNLLTLAVSHGWLAVLLRYSWPAGWLHSLAVGPAYWN